MAKEIAGRLVKFELKTLTVDRASCSYTKTAFTVDVPFLITLFLVRGNSVAKILATTPEEVRAVITRKCSGIGISTTKAAADQRLTDTTVTLTRLSQAFPQATAAIIEGQKIEGKVNPKWLMGLKLPMVMQHSIFSAVISSSITATRDLQVIAVTLNLEMTVMLQTPKEKRRIESRDMGDLEESSQRYVMAAINGSSCTDTIKIKILRTAKIINASDELTVDCMVLLAACNRFPSMNDRTYREAVMAMTRTVVSQAPVEKEEAKDPEVKE